MEIHVGDTRSPEKPSKTEVVFVSKSPKAYADPMTYDGANLSPIKICSHSLLLISSATLAALYSECKVLSMLPTASEKQATRSVLLDC